MQKFTGYEYLLIDIANQFGLDKLLFEERIYWTKDNLDQLEQLTNQVYPKTRPLYIKAVMALRRVQRGEPIGHLVGFDAVCSGLQIMSAITGCVAGATATGLVDPNARADAYTELTVLQNQALAQQGVNLTVPREDSKTAYMTSLYGSKAKPVEIFGENTPELSSFYAAAQKIGPGAWELLQDLLASWQPYALSHAWKLPDGFDVRVKVMQKHDARIEIDELNHATFTYEFYENEGSKKGLSNVANVIHSIDGFVLREMHRRCHYAPNVLTKTAGVIELELLERLMDSQRTNHGRELFSGAGYYINQYARSQMVSAVILPYLTADNVQLLSDRHLNDLADLVASMRVHGSFEIVTVHDEFKCHPNQMNHLRQHYINILASLADSEILSDILSQIHGRSGTITKLSSNLGTKIRNSNYALS